MDEKIPALPWPFSFHRFKRDFLSYSEPGEKTTLLRFIQPDEFLKSGKSIEFALPVKAGI
jgi:hypothetical protein